MASTTIDCGTFQLHGPNVRNTAMGYYCGDTPVINISFKITCTLDAGSNVVTWNVHDVTKNCSATRYDYKLSAYVTVNAGQSTITNANRIFYKPLTPNSSGGSWHSAVQLFNPSGSFTASGGTATLTVWIKNRDNCKHSNNTVFCFNGAGEYVPIWDKSIPIETTYTVSYNANGGSPTLGNQTKSSLSNLTLTSTRPSKAVVVKYYNNGTSTPSDTVTPALTFNNWSASNGGTYSPGGTYTKNEDCVMTAQWGSGSFTPIALPAKYYRVTYIYNAGTGSPAYVDLQRQALGYSKASGSTAVVYHPGASYTISTNLDLYPVYGDAILQFSSLPTPTRNGYSFGGWYRDASFNTKVTTNLTITGDTVLYAKWIALPIHKRNLDGTWSDDGPWVWKYTTSDNQWHKIAPVYKYSSTKSDWGNISGGLPNV